MFVPIGTGMWVAPRCQSHPCRENLLWRKLCVYNCSLPNRIFPLSTGVRISGTRREHLPWSSRKFFKKDTNVSEILLRWNFPARSGLSICCGEFSLPQLASIRIFVILMVLEFVCAIYLHTFAFAGERGFCVLHHIHAIGGVTNSGRSFVRSSCLWDYRFVKCITHVWYYSLLMCHNMHFSCFKIFVDRVIDFVCDFCCFNDGVFKCYWGEAIHDSSEKDIIPAEPATKAPNHQMSEIKTFCC